jgi:hypothetical protein
MSPATSLIVEQLPISRIKSGGTVFIAAQGEDFIASLALHLRDPSIKVGVKITGLCG